MASIGIRELKAGLSAYLRRVQAGERLVITDRGNAIATLGPPEAPAERPDWVMQLVAEGRANWKGGKPKGLTPRIRLKGRGSVSAAVIEDRR